jgi:D-glycero-alpha-D-manno-heptose-7-phosphate kinase
MDDRKILLKYSKSELVDHVDAIEHPIIRCALKRLNIKSGIEISSVADVPSGTGLGSSSSFTVGLLHCLNALQNRYVSKEYLASTACDIEIGDLGEPIGKQDQYSAAYGGLNFIRFRMDGSVQVDPINISASRLAYLQERLLLFYTGKTRPAKSILDEQKRNIESNSKSQNNLAAMSALAQNLRRILYDGDLDQFGGMLDEGWRLKRGVATKVSSSEFDAIYDTAVGSGRALGGKMLGAGGGGFFLFYCPLENQGELRRKLEGLQEVPFKFERSGSSLVFFDDNVRSGNI